MALSVAHGAIQWVATDAVGTTYAVSGLSFQPVAIIFWSVGISSATDAVSASVDSRRSVGWAVSTSARRCVASRSADTAATSICVTGAYDSACVAQVGAASLGLLDLSAIASDGFTLIVDDTGINNATVFWTALGGSDVTVAQVGDFAEPAATGDQDYTATGFVAGATDQVVLIAGVQSSAAMNSVLSEASGLSVGFATVANQVVMTGSADHNTGTMNTDGYCQSGECLARIPRAGTSTVEARASLTQFGADNFRLNWAARAVTGAKSVYLALKIAGGVAVGEYTINTTTASATATVSGLAFQPVAICFMSASRAESTAATASANDRISLGVATSTTSRRAMGVLDNDAAADTEIGTVVEYDSVLCSVTNTGALLTTHDLNAINSDGFQVIVDTNAAGASSTEWQGYVAFGSATATVPAMRPSRVMQAVTRAAYH